MIATIEEHEARVKHSKRVLNDLTDGHPNPCTGKRHEHTNEQALARDRKGRAVINGCGWCGNIRGWTLNLESDEKRLVRARQLYAEIHDMVGNGVTLKVIEAFAEESGLVRRAAREARKLSLAQWTERTSGL